mmetsp:Transcript_63575/g.185903  ORF Transcript_63575/g.185903 Transcript_63575/m.185903 type:complete len:136 (-) Transcript_63575:73-480(-)
MASLRELLQSTQGADALVVKKQGLTEEAQRLLVQPCIDKVRDLIRPKVGNEAPSKQVKENGPTWFMLQGPKAIGIAVAPPCSKQQQPCGDGWRQKQNQALAVGCAKRCELLRLYLCTCEAELCGQRNSRSRAFGM